MIARDFHATLLRLNGNRMVTTVDVQLTYDPDLGPLSIDMTFNHKDMPHPVTWTFYRDSLAEAVRSGVPTGIGDIKFRVDSGGNLFVCLNNPNGHADFVFPVAEAEGFLDDTEGDASRCDLTTAVDQAIAELLG